MNGTIKKTKIVCTLGPACESEHVLTALAKRGMNVARLNFSHGSTEEHRARIRTLRRVSRDLGVFLGIMVDIQGPKLRTGLVTGERVSLAKGNRVVLAADSGPVTGERIAIPYLALARGLRPGVTVYLDDARMELQVEEIHGNEVWCRVVVGGELDSRKGVSLPGVRIDLPAVTEKDKEDLAFAVQEQVDMIALSFVRRGEHVRQVRELIRGMGGNQLLIAKIENEEGLANLDEIILEADGVMVARGDLGVSIPPEEVPGAQKMIIRRCNQAGKPVITATQMLDSMKSSPRPTRAEVTDVANAIIDGSDAIMLSGETAVGKYPEEAVAMMTKIALRTEREMLPDWRPIHEGPGKKKSVEEAIGRATCETARDLEAGAIITATQSGTTARMISKYRPTVHIVAVTPVESVARQLSISWGVYPVIVQPTENIDEMLAVAAKAALGTGLIQKGEVGVITAGLRPGVPGSTNLLKVHVVE